MGPDETSRKAVADDIAKRNDYLQARISKLIRAEREELMRYEQFLLEQNFHLEVELKELRDKYEFQLKVNDMLHDEINGLREELNYADTNNGIQNLDN